MAFDSLLEKAEVLAYAAVDKGLIPDFLLRLIIKHLCNIRKSSLESHRSNLGALTEYKHDYIMSLAQRDIAIETDKANEQHYEVSTEFLRGCLGKRMKYSACFYDERPGSLTQSSSLGGTLDEAEERMLSLYCERAKLEDGMDILDLGCGWGSLAIFLAEKYPNSKVSALSNSKTQKIYIDSKRLENLTVYTGDVQKFEFPSNDRFDRILSIEMLEHMKNYAHLFSKISSWLKPNADAKGNDGSLFFAHIFCHRDTPYHFEVSDGWMAKMFFSGGTMPSYDLFTYFQKDLELQRTWWINGKHYSKTCEDWLKSQDESNRIEKRFPSQESNKSAHEDEYHRRGASVRALEADALKKGASAEEGRATFYRFRVFFLTCAVFFGLDDGETWGVGHYLFKGRN